MREEKWLKLLLRLAGVMMLSMGAGLVVPMPWMAACHEWLGVGSLPDDAIVEYLARGMFGLSAMVGLILLAVSGEVRRYGPVIAIISAGCIALGVVLWSFMGAGKGTYGLYATIDGAVAIALFAPILALQARMNRPH